MQGRCFVFGDEIDTNVIAPGGFDMDNLVDNLMNPLRPEFSDEVNSGDIIVAGRHFGSGSARETAPMAIREAGIQAVISESFARIYYRNSINLGLPALIAPGVTDVVSEGDEVEVDFEDSIFRDLTNGEDVEFEPVPDEIRAIYDAGGLFEYYESTAE